MAFERNVHGHLGIFFLWNVIDNVKLELTENCQLRSQNKYDHQMLPFQIHFRDRKCLILVLIS